MVKKCLWGLIFLTGAAAAAPPYAITSYLAVRGNGSPAWLAPGVVGFLNSSSGAAQLWRLDGPGAAPTRLTDVADGVDAYYTHPASGRVIVAADAAGDERTQLYLMNADGSGLTPLTANPAAAYEFGDWSRDGRYVALASNERDERYFDVYVLDLTTGERRCLVQEDGYNLAVAFSPDGSRLVSWRAHGAHDGDLFLVDLAAGGGEPEPLTPHEAEAEVGNVAWAADGAGFYFTSNQGRDFMSLAYYELAARTFRWVETPPWDVEAVATSPDGRWLAWLTNEDGSSRLAVRDLRTGEAVPTPAPAMGVLGDLRFSPDGAEVLWAWQTPTAPADVYRWRVGDAAATRVTSADLAGLPPDAFTAPALVAYPSFDGTMVPAFLYLPAGTADDGRTPALVVVHGGPEFQARPGFDAVNQYFANAGYAVFVPNIRGSTGYGRAYADADNVARRPDAVSDCFYGWRYLAEQPWCDRLKIAIMGSSYGGYMVLAQLVAKPYYWAAGVDIRGISNFVSYMENTGPWRVELREEEYGSPAEDRELMTALSPVTNLYRLRAPLMVIHGANDVRVPLEQAEQVVAGARKIIGAAKVVYIVYADEGHGLSKRANQLDAYPRVVAFLEQAFAARDELRAKIEAALKADAAAGGAAP